MAKLSNDAILELLRSKGYEAVDISGYKNLSSEIVIKCPQGHILTTDLTSFRSEKFYCPRCEGIEVGSTFVNPRIPPAKNGYRIVAFDQATEKMGISI